MLLSTIYQDVIVLIFFFFFSSRRRHTRLQGDWSSDVCFFFSSRRRHTRLQGDWSSDVCSSDLIGRATALLLAQAGAGVAVGYRSRRAEADETLAGVKRLRRPAIGVAGDLGDPAAAGRAVDDAVQGLRGLAPLTVRSEERTAALP